VKTTVLAVPNTVPPSAGVVTTAGRSFSTWRAKVRTAGGAVVTGGVTFMS
jgi:hypothetical protein